MYSAPSVTYPVGRCRFYAWVLVVLALASASVLGVWMFALEQPGVGSLGAWGVALWMVWLAFAATSWWRSPVGQLRWDPGTATQEFPLSAGWWWRSAASPDDAPLQQVTMVFDLQNQVLLSLRGADALSRWVWAERTRDPLRWPDLRRSLMSHT